MWPRTYQGNSLFVLLPLFGRVVAILHRAVLLKSENAEWPVKTRLATSGVGKGTRSPKQRERDSRRDVPKGHGRGVGFAEVLPSSFPAARSFGGSTMARCALAPISQVKLLESFCNIVLRDTVNVKSRANFCLHKSAIYTLDHTFHLYRASLFIRQISTGLSDTRILGIPHRLFNFCRYCRTFFTKIINIKIFILGKVKIIYKIFH